MALAANFTVDSTVGLLAPTQAQVSEAYGTLPLSFEINQGQTDAQVKFLSRGRGYTLFLSPSEAVLTLSKPAAQPEGLGNIGIAQMTTAAGDMQSTQHTVLRMQLVGANPEPQVTGLDELPGKSNYFIGSDPTKWFADVAHYAKVKYQNVYPGVDLIYYGDHGQLEYDFIVAPGADYDTIRLGFEGADKLTLDAQGNLVLHTASGEVIQRVPVVHQEIDGVKQVISASYVLHGRHQVGFQVAAYDVNKALVIDPVLEFSTYLGGSDTDAGPTLNFLSINVDTVGNVYVAGTTLSPDFPTKDPFQATSGGKTDVFVTKLNAAGSALIYSTYLGGSGHDFGHSIALDVDNNAYVAGLTQSTNFPVTGGAFQTTIADLQDSFVTKLNAAGSALIYSTYLGGSGGRDEVMDIAVDSDGNAHVVGQTDSTNFPVTEGAFQTTHGGDRGDRDAFVTKLNPDGSGLIYSTYLGGSSSPGLTAGETGWGIAVDNDGNAYVVGDTTSRDFPVTEGAF